MDAKLLVYIFIVCRADFAQPNSTQAPPAVEKLSGTTAPATETATNDNSTASWQTQTLRGVAAMVTSTDELLALTTPGPRSLISSFTPSGPAAVDTTSLFGSSETLTSVGSGAYGLSTDQSAGDVQSATYELTVANASSSGDTISLGGIGIAHCPLWSCLNRCFISTHPTTTSHSNLSTTTATAIDSDNATASSNCACDRSCMALGDCCVDFFSLCLNITDEAEVVSLMAQTLYGETGTGSDGTDAEAQGADNYTVLIKSYGSCVLTPTGERFTMVTSCPLGSTKTVVTMSCEEAEKHPNLQPHSVNQYMALTFRNIDCARCHGYSLDLLTPWVQGVACKDLAAGKNHSLDGILEALRAGNCSYVYSSPAGASTKPRLCLPPFHEFNPSGNITQTEQDEKCTFEDYLLCQSYSYQTWTENDQEVKNPHCLKCQTGLTPIAVELPCSRKQNGTTASKTDSGSGSMGGILALFSATSSGDHAIVVGGRTVSFPGFMCKDDEVYDYVFLVCRTLFCPSGFRPVAGKCTLVETYFVPSKWQKVPEGTDTLYVSLGEVTAELCQSQIPAARIASSFRTHCPDSCQQMLLGVEFSCNTTDSQNASDKSTSLKMTITQITNLTAVFEALADMTRDVFQDPNISAPVVVVAANYVMEPLVVCAVGNPEFVNRANVTSIDGQLYVQRQDHSYTSLYPLNNVIFRAGFSVLRTSDGNGTTPTRPSSIAAGDIVFSALLCVQPQMNTSLNCSAVPFTINRTRIVNKTLFITDTDLFYPEGMFELHDIFVLVCSDFRNLNYLWNGVKFFQFSDAQYYLSWACSLTSVVSLLMSLVAFALLPHLRTLAGRMNASLATSLAAGQLLILVDFAEQRLVCSVIAAVCHFCWLAAFSWMTALAVHMARTFHGNMTTIAGKYSTKQVRKEYAKYAAVCWGLPAVLVGVLYTTNMAPHTPFKVGYGHPLCGWMQQTYVFLIPAAVALTVNVVCFLMTLISIERTLRASKAAVAGQHSSDRQRLVVYTKMVCVMGFTWLAGFLAAFTGEAALWWAYIILNGLQGTFIAFSFVLNARLLRFLKKRQSERGSGVDMAWSEAKTGRDCRRHAISSSSSSSAACRGHALVCRLHPMREDTAVHQGSDHAEKVHRRSSHNYGGCQGEMCCQGLSSRCHDDHDDDSRDDDLCVICGTLTCGSRVPARRRASTAEEDRGLECSGVSVTVTSLITMETRVDVGSKT